MAEKEQLHSHHMQTQAIALEASHLHYFKLGQLFAFTIAVLSIALSTLLAFLGHEKIALALCGFALTGVVGAFIAGYLQKQKDEAP